MVLINRIFATPYAIYKPYKLSQDIIVLYWVKTWHQDGRIFSIICSLDLSAVRNDRRRLCNSAKT